MAPIDFPALAQIFVRWGWAVVMPARRGCVSIVCR
jgi:hypothetical protein